MQNNTNLETNSSGYTTVTIQLEGFREPLHVSVPKNTSPDEFQQLTTEILQNYIMDLKDKALVDQTREDLILINQEDYHELSKADLSAHLSGYRKIIIGFTGIENLKNEFAKNKAMNSLNSNVLNKSYQHIEESLSAARGGSKSYS